MKEVTIGPLAGGPSLLSGKAYDWSVQSCGQGIAGGRCGCGTDKLWFVDIVKGQNGTIYILNESIYTQ